VNSGDAWDVLGIPPTDDQRSIQLTYTARLKAIDPDLDPQAFIALRKAYETALRAARCVGSDHQPVTMLSPFKAHDPEVLRHLASVATPLPAAIEAHAETLSALLNSAPDRIERWPTKQERQSMLAHWHAIAASPQLEEVALFARLEIWASDLVAWATPMSDPLVIPVTEYFEWAGSIDIGDHNPDVEYIARRYGQLKFLEAVRQPGHSHHPAWIELTAHNDAQTPYSLISRTPVLQLLALVREVSPEMETRFNPDRVARWERRDEVPPPLQEEDADSRYSADSVRYLAMGLVAIYAASLIYQFLK
jgi:hypothetical protein